MGYVGCMSEYISLYQEEKKFIDRTDSPLETELEDLLEELLGKGKTVDNINADDLHTMNEMLSKEFMLDSLTFKEIAREMLFNSPKLYLWEFILNLIII